MANVQKLSPYAERLEGEAKKRYQEKLKLIYGVDPFQLASNRAARNNAGAVTGSLPPVDASDLVSYLVLETSFVTGKQFKARKSMEAYNQFVCGWIRDVCAWTINGKTVVTGRVSQVAASY